MAAVSVAMGAWQDWELELLRDTSLSLREVAAKTGRPIKGCYNIAYRLKIRRNGKTGIDWSDSRQIRELHRRYDPRATDRRVWEPEELAVLSDVSLTFPEVAEMLDRSEDAARLAARRFGIIRGIRSGAEHPRWRGGQARNYYGEWPSIRRSVLERDGYVCQDCGLFSPSDRRLCVHHRIPFRLYPVNDVSWLTTLCEVCHNRRPEHYWKEIPEDVLLLIREGR